MFVSCAYLFLRTGGGYTCYNINKFLPLKKLLQPKLCTMKRALLLTFTALLFFTISTFAQSSPSDTDLAAHDDGRTLFFFFCLLGIAMFLAMLVGTTLFTGFLIALFSLVSAGLFSTALL